MPTSRLAIAVTGQAEPGCTVGRFGGRASNLTASGVAVGLVSVLVGDTGPAGSPASPQPASRSAAAAAAANTVTAIPADEARPHGVWRTRSVRRRISRNVRPPTIGKA